MTSVPTTPNQWMTLEELREETGMGRSAIYRAANEQTLPLPVFRFGKRFLVSRKAWEALKTQTHTTPLNTVHSSQEATTSEQ